MVMPLLALATVGKQIAESTEQIVFPLLIRHEQVSDIAE